jgi:hypothetical protein
MIALQFLLALAGIYLCTRWYIWLCRPVPKVELMRFQGNEATEPRWRHRMELGGHLARPARLKVEPADLMRWADDGGV